MSTTRFNGAKATISNSTTAIATDVGITSFSYDSGNAAEVDITTSSSVRRAIIKGFASPRRLSLGLLLDQTTITELDAMLAECAEGTVAISFGVDCTAASQLLSLDAYLMSFTVTGQLDGVLEVNCEFMVAEV